MFPKRLPLAIVGLFLALVTAALAAPTVVTINPAPGTVSSLTQIGVTFSEAVAGVDANDLLINNEAAFGLTGSGAGPYTFTFTQPLPGAVNITWDFDHGISGIGTGAFIRNTWSYTLLDTLPPTIAQVKTSVAGQEQLAIAPLPGSVVGVLTSVEVTFSEPVVGVDAGDLKVNGAATATALSGSGAGPYVFTIPQPATGAVTFSWTTGHGITDVSPAANEFAGGSWSLTVNAGGAGALTINEFLAANATSIADENGDQNDWIEIYNPGASAVNLAGWSLTTDPDQPAGWIFPSRTIAAGGYLVVFASAKDRKPASGNLHANFKLNETGGYLALMSPDSPRAVATKFDPYPVQRYDFSYGPQTGGALRYFARPLPVTNSDTRPGTANGTSALTGVTPKPAVSTARGFFKDPFSLLLSCTDSAATIRYTLDGSDVTLTSPTYSAPLAISATTLLRIAAFGANAIPSATVTHSYLFLDKVFDQTSPPYDNPARSDDNSNPQPPSVGGVPLPVAWGTNGAMTFPAVQITNLNNNQVPADYGMDPEIYSDATKYDDTGAVNNATGKTNMERIKQGLRDLPMISVVLKSDDMWGPAGMYSNSTVKGSQFEKACSIEMVLPDGSTAFATTCGIRIHGNSSRNPQNDAKHGFNLNFKGDYGSASLDYQLFPDSPAKKLDDLVLRGDYNSSWLHWDGTTGINGQRIRANRLRDAYCKDTFRAMSGLASHNRYVNLFINGVYWGTYDPTEKESDSFAANYLGGDKSDYDVYEQGLLKAGTTTAYTAMTSIASPIDNTKYELMKQYLDIPEFVDYMLFHFWTGHQDWGDDPSKNWYAVRNRTKNGTFKYLPWDQENLLWDPAVDRTGVPSPPSGLHPKLVTNAQYQLDFADRVHRHLVALDGALQPVASTARFNKWKSVLTNAIAGESARWGDYRRDVHQYSSATYPLYTWNGHWIAECNRLTSTYFPVRTTNVLAQLRARSLYPTLNAVQYANNANGTVLASQRVTAGFLLKMQLTTPTPSGTTSAGTIYFTTDSSDPRVTYTGAVATPANGGTAQIYTAPRTINATTIFKSRALNGAVWSALNEATFTVGSTASAVRITEIMYNPSVANGGTSAEFIELQNTGTTPADLSGWSMAGVDFIFPVGFTLGAGSRIVLANSNAPATFATQYLGVAVAGYFGSSLSNSGERLALLDATGAAVVAVNYSATGGWPARANGQGYSLEIIDSNGNPDDPANWQASAVEKGTPGQENSTPVTAGVEFSEVMAENASVPVAGVVADYVELRNSTGAAISLAGWSLSNDGNPQKFVFPAGTSVAPNGYISVLCDTGSGGALLHAGFTLNGGPAGDKVQLYNASGARVDGVSWGNQIADLTIGKVSGAWVLSTPTPGAANTAAATASATGNLVVNEWLANPNPGSVSWLEIYNKSATAPVALKGLYVQTSAQLFQITTLAFVPANGWLQLFSDELPGVNHVDFTLPASGTTLSLLDSVGASLDSVTFGAQAQGVSQGRNPDGSATIVTFTGSPSPGAANYVSNWTGPVLNEALAINVASALSPGGTHATWLEIYNPTASSFPLGGMKLGVVNDFSSAWTIPAGTSVAAGSYLVIWCDASQPPSTIAGPDLNTGVPLSGTSGGAYLFTSNGQLVNQVEWGFQITDRSIGLDAGTWKLLATPTLGTANSAAGALGAVTNLRINEWMAAPSSGTDWFELYNLATSPVAMDGLYLSDDPSELGRTKFKVPQLSFIAANGWVRWRADSTPELGRNHVNFSLDSNAETIRISNNDAAFTAIDIVTFGLQTTGVSQGRIPDGAANIVFMPGSPTPAAKNVLLPAPTFSAHPAGQTLSQGTNVTFTAAASGSAPLTLQWKFNGADISGATGTTLNVNGVMPANDGNYTLVATNTAGVVSSNVAKLLVTQNFSQWATTQGLTGNNALPGADPDGDGITNIQELFHHLNPNAEAGASDMDALPKVGVEPATGTPQYLTLTYRTNPRATFMLVEHQISATLGSGTWTTLAPDVIEPLAPDPATGDPRVRVKFSIQPGDTKKFLRLQLTP